MTAKLPRFTCRRQKENQTIFGEPAPLRAGYGREPGQIGREPRPQLVHFGRSYKILFGFPVTVILDFTL